MKHNTPKKAFDTIVFIGGCLIIILSLMSTLKRKGTYDSALKVLKHENDSLKVENHVKDQFIDIILHVDSISIK